jgi:hypothetical protein
MPTQFAALDNGFPSFTGRESTEQKVDALYNYVFLLLENLRYILRNLSPENFNEAEMKDWGNEIVTETVISNTVITNELYAEYGAIADLVVDELRTDYQKAARYLAGNTAALDYLHIHDEEIDFLTGTVKTENGAPLTEQLHHGSRCFWWTDAEHTRMTSLEPTAWPVTVYQYNELVKGTYRFEDVTEEGVTTKIPELVFGAGYGSSSDPDRGKGYLRKNRNSFDLWLLNRFGERQGIFIGDPAGGGYTDITGLRKTTEIDFSDWDNGSFTETLDGEIVNSYAVEFDSQDRPVLITDGSGHETEIIWE